MIQIVNMTVECVSELLPPQLTNLEASASMDALNASFALMLQLGVVEVHLDDQQIHICDARLFLD